MTAKDTSTMVRMSRSEARRALLTARLWITKGVQWENPNGQLMMDTSVQVREIIKNLERVIKNS